MKTRRGMHLAIFVFVTSVRFSEGQKSCAQFTFSPSNITTKGIEARENTNVSFSFNLRNQHCKNISDVDISLYKSDVRQCAVRWQSGTCQVSNPTAQPSLCRCQSDTGPYVFTKTASRLDNAQWKLSTFDETADDVMITFTITYPARVINLTVDVIQSLEVRGIPTNRTVHVVCSWINGNPPTDGYLLDNFGKRLSERSRSGKIEQDIIFQQCLKVITIHCEVEGSEINMSTSLQTTCPPHLWNKSINVTVIAGHSVDVTFPVLMHSSPITGCQVAKCFNQSHSRGNPIGGYFWAVHQCPESMHASNTKSLPEGVVNVANSNYLCCLNGSTPTQTLHVLISHVQVQDVVQWCVKLINTEGSESLQFFLNVSSDATKHEKMENLVTLVASVTSAVVISVILANVAFCILFKRRGRQKNLDLRIMSEARIGLQLPLVNRTHRDPVENESDLPREIDDRPL